MTFLGSTAVPVYDLHSGGCYTVEEGRFRAWKRAPHRAHCHFEPTDDFFRAVHAAGWKWDDGNARVYTFLDAGDWRLAYHRSWFRQSNSAGRSKLVYYQQVERGGVARVEHAEMTPDDEDEVHAACGGLVPFGAYRSVRHRLVGMCDAYVDVVTPPHGAPFVIGCVRDRVPPPLFDRLKLSPTMYAHALAYATAPSYPRVLPPLPDRATYTAWLRRP